MGAPVSASVYRKAEQILELIFAVDSTGAAQTGLVNGDFTKWLLLNGAVSATTVTVTEVNAVTAPGLYKVTFTPGSTGHWSLRMQKTTSVTENWTSSWNVENSDLGDLDLLKMTALATSGTTSGTIEDILRTLEANAWKGRRLTYSYDGSNRVSTVLLELSFDAFVTINHSATFTYTYGAPATPLRPTIVTIQ